MTMPDTQIKNPWQMPGLFALLNTTQLKFRLSSGWQMAKSGRMELRDKSKIRWLYALLSVHFIVQ
jgi:hypothetical protein